MIRVYADGGARGNPGPAAIGIVIVDDKSHVLKQHKERIGVATNNVAEYSALLKALELAAQLTSDAVQVYMDSEVVVRQVTGVYQIKAVHLLPLYYAVKKREAVFKVIRYGNVARDAPYQILADKLVNEALDRG
jgi:ribonuclease HI